MNYGYAYNQLIIMNGERLVIEIRTSTQATQAPVILRRYGIQTTGVSCSTILCYVNESVNLISAYRRFD